jgi:hypothetical protein
LSVTVTSSTVEVLLHLQLKWALHCLMDSPFGKKQWFYRFQRENQVNRGGYGRASHAHNPHIPFFHIKPGTAKIA